MVKGAIAASFLGLATSSAASQVVYLECAESSSSGTTIIDVTLNEGEGTAGYFVRATGSSTQKITATFTPSSVSFVTPAGLYGRIVTTIDRSTLVFQRTIYIGDKANPRPPGKCILAPKIERQF